MRNKDFLAAYDELEMRFKRLAEKENGIYIPNMKPRGPMDFVFICTEPSLGAWARNKELPDQWKGSKPITTPRGIQEMITLSEHGMCFFLGRSDKPLFFLAGLCAILEPGNPSMIEQRTDEDDLNTIEAVDSSRQKPKVTVILWIYVALRFLLNFAVRD